MNVLSLVLHMVLYGRYKSNRIQIKQTVQSLFYVRMNDNLSLSLTIWDQTI